MKELKQKVISYLNMELNPTVIGFQDNGLYYLFNKLLQGTVVSNGYDPTFSFLHISLNYLKEINLQRLEEEINEGLQRDLFPGNTLYETFQNNIEVVCILDDLSYIENPVSAIEASDRLISKYRNKIHFIYLIEDPFFLEKLKGKVAPSSAVLDAFIFQEIGNSWETKELEEIFNKQFKTKLTTKEINEISLKSNNHFGLFKRLYQDKALKINSAERYLELLIENFEPKVINLLRKIAKNIEITDEEVTLKKAYEKIGLIKDNKITISFLEDKISKAIIENKITLNSEEKITGLDLNLLTNSERRVIETLMRTNETITKDEMAEIIWKENVNEKYSPWALDQRISRIRKKLIDLGFNIDIQTVYSKGYKLIKIK